MRSVLLLLVFLPLVLSPSGASAAGVERRLHPQPVEASSFLWNDWNRFQENYHPIYVADDDPRTAWTEGVDSSGAGEWIRFHVTAMEGATRVRLSIRAGYQKSTKLFKANARPREVTVKLLPGGQEARATLVDREGWQEVVVEQPAGKLDAIELRVGSVYEGSKYTDLCISDVRIFATATTRENPAYEKAKLQKTRAWKAERVRAAKTFKEKAAADVPLLPAYRLATHGEADWSAAWEGCDERPALCRLEKSVARAAADPAMTRRAGKSLAFLGEAVRALDRFVPVKLAPMDRRPILAVDGLHVPDLWQAAEGDYGYEGMELPLLGVLAVFRAEQLGALEVERKGRIEAALAGELPGCDREAGRTYAWAMKEKSAERKDVLRALVLVQCGAIEVRDGEMTVAQLQILVYDEAGRLALVAAPGYVNAFTWSTAEGSPVLGEGRGVFLDGRVHELTGPAVARTP